MKLRWLGLLLLLLVAGCGPVIRDGQVMCKRSYPSHRSQYVTYLPCGKVMIPQWHYVQHPERYEITIQKFVEEDKKIHMRDFEVSKEEYDRIKQGDYYSR